MEFNLPKGWEDISLNQYTEYSLTQEKDFVSKVSYTFDRLAVLLDFDLDDEEFEELSSTEAIEYFNNMPWALNKPFTDTFSELEGLTLIDFKQITLGTFIDIEYYLHKERNFSKVATFLYRKVKLGEWNEAIYEPSWAIPIEERALMFGKMPVTIVYGAIQSYLSFRAELLEAHNGSVFEEEDEEVYDDEEVEVDVDAENKLKVQEHWNWEHILYILAGRNLLMMEKSMELNVIYAFNLLNMHKDLEL